MNNAENRLNQGIEKQAALEIALEKFAEGVKVAMDDYRTWTATELTKAQREIARLQEEKNLAVVELIRPRKTLASIREFLKP